MSEIRFNEYLILFLELFNEFDDISFQIICQMYHPDACLGVEFSTFHFQFGSIEFYSDNKNMTEYS